MKETLRTPKEDYPLTPDARTEQQAELVALRQKSGSDIGDFWQRYRDLGEEMFFRGLSRDRLLELGGSLRDGITFPSDIQNAFLAGRIKGMGEFEKEVGNIGLELQKVISFARYTPPTQ